MVAVAEVSAVAGDVTKGGLHEPLERSRVTVLRGEEMMSGLVGHAGGGDVTVDGGRDTNVNGTLRGDGRTDTA